MPFGVTDRQRKLYVIPYRWAPSQIQDTTVGTVNLSVRSSSAVPVVRGQTGDLLFIGQEVRLLCLANIYREENAITFPEQLSRRSVPRERLDNLLRSPFSRRIRRHVEVNDATPGVTQYYKYEQQPKTNGWRDEETHPNHVRYMILDARFARSERAVSTCDVAAD